MTLSETERRRRARAGRGVLPPNPSQWGNEHNGLDLRDDLGLDLDAVLPHESAFSLLENVSVLRHGEVPAAMKYVAHLRKDGRSRWSGLAIQMPDGCELVLYNDSHPMSRIRATLMEEFFHIKLGHPRSEIRILGSGNGSRTYNEQIEQEAYASGAAALVPYFGLKAMLVAGTTPTAIAQAFQVSRDLISYRMKVTKLFALAKRKRP